jgi:hypothetical protein
MVGAWKASFADCVAASGGRIREDGCFSSSPASGRVRRVILAVVCFPHLEASVSKDARLGLIVGLVIVLALCFMPFHNGESATTATKSDAPVPGAVISPPSASSALAAELSTQDSNKAQASQAESTSVSMPSPAPPSRARWEGNFGPPPKSTPLSPLVPAPAPDPQ